MSKSVVIDNLVNDQLYGFRIFPRNLKGQYQTEIDGATATATPKAIPPIFGEATWEQINLASTTNAIPSTWHVGDTKDITLTTGETLTMQIYGFNHDDLSDGSGKAGITFGTKNLMKDTRQMNSTNTNIGGFTASQLYAWLQGSLLDSLPNDLKSYIKNVNKKTTAGNESTNVNTNSMKIFLFSISEVSRITLNEGTIYSIFSQDENNRIKSRKWWLRSPSTSSREAFFAQYEYMSINAMKASTSNGVCFGFCI